MSDQNTCACGSADKEACMRKVLSTLYAVTAWIHSEDCTGNVYQRTFGRCLCRRTRKAVRTRRKALAVMRKHGVPNNQAARREQGFHEVADLYEKRWWTHQDGSNLLPPSRSVPS